MSSTKFCIALSGPQLNATFLSSSLCFGGSVLEIIDSIENEIEFCIVGCRSSSSLYDRTSGHVLVTSWVGIVSYRITPSLSLWQTLLITGAGMFYVSYIHAIGWQIIEMTGEIGHSNYLQTDHQDKNSLSLSPGYNYKIKKSLLSTKPIKNEWSRIM